MTNEPFWPQEEDDEEPQDEKEDLRHRFRRLTGEDDDQDNGGKRTRPAEDEEVTDTARHVDDTATIPGGIKPAALPYQAEPETEPPAEDEIDLTGGLYGQGPAPDADQPRPESPNSPPVGEPTGGWYGGDTFQPIDVNADGIDELEEIEKQALSDLSRPP